MAIEHLVITFETDALRDMIGELEALGRALTSRHGEPFRELDRRLMRIVEGDFSCPTIEDVGPGVMMVGAPPELSALLRDARALGVI